jgi:hypothetical protein
MTQIITLELPEEIVEQAQAIAKRKGRSISALFVELIEKDESAGSAQPILYPTETPYGNEEAAKIMQEMIQSSTLPKVIKKR